MDDASIYPEEVVISIHAPREGGDLEVNKMVKIKVISIHAPREGGDRRPHRPVG